MNEYEVLGEFYDDLNSDMDYPALCDYIAGLLGRYHKEAGLVLDLGCGTGGLTLELLKRGYDLIGLDHSPAMLQKALEKTESYRERALFIRQDMLAFELYGTVDAVLATMDVVNHVLYKRDLRRMFQNIHHYLNPGGLFIFDINTAYKLLQVLKNNIFVWEENEIHYIWENNSGEKANTVDFNFTFFVKEGALYRKYQEAFTERAYSVEELKEMLLSCGFRVMGICGDRTFSPPAKSAQRIFFVVKKD